MEGETDTQKRDRRTDGRTDRRTLGEGERDSVRERETETDNTLKNGGGMKLWPTTVPGNIIISLTLKGGVWKIACRSPSKLPVGSCRKLNWRTRNVLHRQGNDKPRCIDAEKLTTLSIPFPPQQSAREKAMHHGASKLHCQVHGGRGWGERHSGLDSRYAHVVKVC